MSQAPVIGVIEDNPQIRQFLRTALGAHGFQVHEAESGKKGLVMAGSRKADLIILDLGLPDMDGIEVVKELRKWTTRPVIILSARDAESEKVAALDAGADDYLTKPFGVDELLARIRVALRHASRSAQPGGGTTYVCNGLKVDLSSREVFRDEEKIHLTPLEFRLLAMLARHPGKVLTHRQLLLEVWGPSYVEHDHYLRIYMGALRRKLERDPARPQVLTTEAGVGYRLKAE